MASSANGGAVYGGDEINAIVLDAGSYTTRIGYAGDDYPKVTVPSCYAKTEDKKIFGLGMEYPRAKQEIIPIMKDSMIVDWEGAVEQYRYYFDNILKIDYQEQPIIITEPVWTTKEYRQKLVETIFREFDFPALYLVRTPTCISFQQGRSTCLVVDIGHDSVSVTPVVDGICLLRNSMRTNYGGHFLDDQIRYFLRTRYPGADTLLKYKIKEKTPTKYPGEAKYTPKNVSEDISKSYDDFQQQKIFQEFKELLIEVPDKKVSKNSQSPSDDKDSGNQQNESRLFELPSGQSIEVGPERMQLGDAIFDPASYSFEEDEELQKKYPANNGELNISSPYDDYRPLKRARKADSGQNTPTPAPDSAAGKTVRGLSHLITHALSAVDIDLRSSFANNIIVTGGISLIPQLTERLYNDLLSTNPGLKIRLHSLGNSVERTNQAWVGGSVLASLGTFHQMWVTKAEYEEAGPDRILTQRFR